MEVRQVDDFTGTIELMPVIWLLFPEDHALAWVVATAF